MAKEIIDGREAYVVKLQRVVIKIQDTESVPLHTPDTETGVVTAPRAFNSMIDHRLRCTEGVGVSSHSNSNPYVLVPNEMLVGVDMSKPLRVNARVVVWDSLSDGHFKVAYTYAELPLEYA